MPIPQPSKGENKKKFLPRCMGDNVMVKDYKDIKQRYAICMQKWNDRNKEKD